MDEKYLETVLNILAREIEQLRITIDILRYEKKQLEERLEIFTSPTQEVIKDA